MTKTTLIQILSETACEDTIQRFAKSLNEPLKVTRLAPLEDNDVDVLIEFEGTPTDAQAGIDQAHKLREHLEADLGITLDLAEMVPRRSCRNGTIGFHTVVARFKMM